MNIIDIANKIDKTEKNEEWIDLREIANKLDLDIYSADISYDQDRLKCYWVSRWLCDVEYVGQRMYFFDDEPVAISSKSKCDEYFQWFSEECARKVRDYLLSFEREKELLISLIDINDEMRAEGIKISSINEIIDTDRVFYNDEKVEIKELIRSGSYEDLIITLSNGEDKKVNIRDLLFKYRLNE